MEYVSRYQFVRSLFVSAVVLGAAVLFGSLFLMPSAAHAAANTLSTQRYVDANINGTVESVLWTFQDNLTQCSYDAADWTVNTASEMNFVITGVSCATNVLTIAVTSDADETSHETAPVISYANVGTADSLQDAGGAITAKSNKTTTDGAGPVLLSASPTALQGGVRSSANIVLTFSEGSLNGFGDSLTPISIVTTNSGAATGIVTVAHSARFPVGQISYTIAAAADPAGNTFAGVQAGDTTLSNPLVFYVTSGSDDDDEEEVTYSVNLLTPEADDSFEAGDMTEITWESDGGQASYVNLYYSEDGGTTWETIVTNSLNDGTYTWTAPHVDSDEIVVKIVTTDLAEELATDTSAAFSLWFYSEDEDVTEDEETDEEVADDEEEVTEIDGVMAGDYIKVSGGSTIYYVDEDMTRRPFFDEQTYFTYEDDFDAVVEVSDETLAEFVMGAPMMPEAGVVLVKIQSVAKVYYVEQDADGDMWLRWVTSEDVAEEMFGTNWSSYVVDVDVTLFTRYEEGEDIDSAFAVDTDDMKLGSELHD